MRAVVDKPQMLQGISKVDKKVRWVGEWRVLDCPALNWDHWHHATLSALIGVALAEYLL